MAKQLLLGNQAAAMGARDGGIAVISSYPGTPSTEITETAAAFPEVYTEWAANEKVAAEAFCYVVCSFVFEVSSRYPFGADQLY